MRYIFLSNDINSRLRRGVIKKSLPYPLLLLFFLISSCGSAEQNKEDTSPVITSESNDTSSVLVGIVDEDVSAIESENQNTYSEFIDFPASFEEDNILPIKTVASQQKNKNQMFGIVEQKTRRVSKKPNKKVIKKKPNLSLSKVRKMYYDGDHRKLVSIYFSSNELDKLYYKGLSYLMLAQQSPRKKSYYVAKAKFIFDRIGRTTDEENLKAKSLLWLSIAELEYPNKTKTFSKRIYPLRYIVEKLSDSRIVNDAQLYLALFHQENKDYQEAISYFYRVRESDKDNLVYDFNLKRMVPPTVAVEYYLRQLEAVSGNIFLNDNAATKNIGNGKTTTPRRVNATMAENAAAGERGLAVSPALAKPISSGERKTAGQGMTEIEKKIDEFRKGNGIKSSIVPKKNGEETQQETQQETQSADPYFFAGDDEEIFFEDSQQEVIVPDNASDAINQEMNEKTTVPSNNGRVVPAKDKVDLNASNMPIKGKKTGSNVEAIGSLNLGVGVDKVIGRTTKGQIVEKEFVFE